MSKSAILEPVIHHPRRQTRRNLVLTSILLILTLCLATSWLFRWYACSEAARSVGQPVNILETEEDIAWTDITPSTTLTYTPCFGGFDCARLLVPLNWNATQAEQQQQQQVALAVIRWPAAVPITDPRYGGAVLVNPGGPGESGIFQVLSDGAALQTILDTGNLTDVSSTKGKFYDIVSFDPRGVNNTTPPLRCFPSAFTQQVWHLSNLDYGFLWESERVIGMEWARAAALGSSCARDPGGILRYSNTAQTVEDMLHLVEKIGEWRDNEARRALSDTSTADEATLGRLAYHPGHEKLQYWGVSYGTVLGSTFAAMHPDRIGRMILDGVVDPADHYAGGWLTQLQDSDSIISQLSSHCFSAGALLCPLYDADGAEAIERRFTTTMQALKEDPIVVDHHGPVFITYGDAHLHLLSGMYFPIAMAEELFQLVAALETRNASSPAITALAARKTAALIPAPADPNTLPAYVSAMGVMQSIACMDSIGSAAILTRQAFQSYLSELQSQGRWISPTWALNKLACVGYPEPPAWRPPFTFRTQQWANTSHPLLMIGNSHDTVTPVRNARRVAGMFPGSVVVQQDSEGHCSHSTPSLCTARAVRAYMATGRLPPEGTVCEPDIQPFVGCLQRREVQCQFEGEDRRMFDALIALADPFKLQSKESSLVFPLHLL